MKLTPFRMTEQMHKAAKKEAKAQGRSFSGYVRRLIQADLSRLKKGEDDK